MGGQARSWDRGGGSGVACWALGLLFELLLPASPSLGKASDAAREEDSNAAREECSDAARAPASRACKEGHTQLLKLQTTRLILEDAQEPQHRLTTGMCA